MYSILLISKDWNLSESSKLNVDNSVKKSGNVGLMLINTKQIYLLKFIPHRVKNVDIWNPQKYASMLRKKENCV